MAVSKERITDILVDDAILGREKTMEKYGISYDTVRRYKDFLREGELKETHGKRPKVLLFDIETSPMHVRVWGLHKQSIPMENIVESWFVISWAGKWLYGDKIFGDVVTPEEAIDRNDKRIVKSIWDIFEEADIVIAHNGDRFDIRKLNTRWIIHGMIPPSPYQSIDTLKAARRFSFPSNKLDYLSKLFHNKGKIKTNYSLWTKCEAGDAGALAEMFAYNKEDVAILEEVYLTLRPWIKSHPNLSLYMEPDKHICTNCGSEAVVPIGDFWYTPAGKFKAIRCANCGAIGRLPQNMINKVKPQVRSATK